MNAFFCDRGSVVRKLNDSVDYFDVYGFAVFADETTLRDDRCHEFKQDVLPIGTTKEWSKLFKRWTHYKNGLGVKLLSLVKKGVPDDVRAKLWKKLLDIDLLKNSTQFCYQEQVAKLRDYLTLLNVTEYNTDRAEQELCHVEMYELRNDGLNVDGEPSVQDLRQILLDVARTFPTHLLFLGDSAEAIEGRASLFRILAVYARFNPSVGYCQGMSFIAGMLAMVLSEEDSFWCMVALLQKPKYLQGYFDVSLSRVQMHAKIFDRLLKQRQAQLWEHLRNHNVDPLMYITPWLMCLFTSLPCWDVVLSIWDLILLEGFTVIFRVALAIMEVLKDTFLLEKDCNQLITVLQRPPASSVSRTLLLPAVWKTSVDLWELQTIQAVIDEEMIAKDGSKDSMTTAASSCSTKSSQGSKPPAWKRVKMKIRNDEPSLLSKIAKMFNAKPRVTTVIPANCVSSNVCNHRLANVNTINGCLTPRLASPLRDLKPDNAMSNSTSENLNRIRRIVSGKKSRTQSVESLGKGVEYVADGGAGQMQAFGAFSHQLPLRQNQRSRTSLIGSGFSPEMELQCMTAKTDDRLKRRRGSNDTPSNNIDGHECATPQAMPKFRKHGNKRQQQDGRTRFRHFEKGRDGIGD